jgi:sugar O-acyltransferase (sialic acid O-acetyltransferase NeuD family)
MQVLGISKSSFCVICDVIAETEFVEEFEVFSNISAEIIPNTPVRMINYQIAAEGSWPEKTKGVVFGASGPGNKAAIYEYFFEKAYIEKNDYKTILHPTAYIARSVKVNPGVLVEPGAIISSQAEIGFGVTIKRGSSIGHHTQIGDYTDINPGVVCSGNVVIGRGCSIGSGTTIKDGITIGDNVLIGAGSVVVSDIPENMIAFGNPCKGVRANDKWKI